MRRLAVWLGVLAFIPVVLTLIYALPFVHPVSTLMLKDLVTLQGYDRRWVEIEDVQPALLHSIIMSEDGQFCRHYGIDLGAVKEVIGDALDGSPTRGASTITMQVVKNLYLWQGRSVLRKVLEAPLAVMADLILSKKRIMEIYINIAELGPHTYGFEAAAQRNFGRSAADLSRRQAALLTVTLPNPFLRKATKPGPGLSRLARLIERRAIKAGDYVGCVN